MLSRLHRRVDIVVVEEYLFDDWMVVHLESRTGNLVLAHVQYFKTFKSNEWGCSFNVVVAQR